MTHRSLDDVWQNIVATLELGNGLRFAFVEVEDAKTRTKLRQRLQRHLEKQGKSLRSPATKQDPLDWLGLEQTPPGRGEPPEETRWVILPRAPKERFFLHRLNEQRDNFRRNMAGVLFLVGPRGILQRLGNEAPDLWSVRELALDLGGPSAEEKPAELRYAAKPVKRRAESKPLYDVYLSFSRHDWNVARELRSRLEKDGLRVLEGSDAFLGSPLQNRVRLMAGISYYICLLSPSYVFSSALAEDLQWIRHYKHGVFPNRFIPIMVRTTVMPPEIRNLAYLDFRTDQQLDANYPQLLQILKTPPA